jgi:hypothetical protein
MVTAGMIASCRRGLLPASVAPGGMVPVVAANGASQSCRLEATRSKHPGNVGCPA